MKIITCIVRAILCFIGIVSLLVTVAFMALYVALAIVFDVLFQIRILPKP